MAMRAKVVSIATKETQTQGLSDPGDSSGGYKHEWPPALPCNMLYGRGNNRFTVKCEQSVIPGEDTDADREVIAVVVAGGNGSTE